MSLNRLEKRPYYKNSNSNPDFDLGRNSRSHLAGIIKTTYGIPCVEELYDVHGEEAKCLARELKNRQGNWKMRYDKLELGDVYSTYNPKCISPNRRLGSSTSPEQYLHSHE